DARLEEDLRELVVQIRVLRPRLETIAVEVDAVRQLDGEDRKVRVERLAVARRAAEVDLEAHAQLGLVRAVRVGPAEPVGRIVPLADEIEALVEIEAEAEVQIPRELELRREAAVDAEDRNRDVEVDLGERLRDDVAEIERELERLRGRCVLSDVTEIDDVAALVQEAAQRRVFQDVADARDVAEDLVDRVLDEIDQP